MGIHTRKLPAEIAESKIPKEVLAVKLYQLAATKGNMPAAYCNLASRYFLGDGAEKDNERAKKILRCVLEKDVHKSQWPRANYWTGRIVYEEEKYDEAIKLFDKSATVSKDKDAYNYLYLCFFKKASLLAEKRDYREASALLKKIPRDSKHFLKANQLVIQIYGELIDGVFKPAEVAAAPAGAAAAEPKEEALAPIRTEGWLRLTPFIHVFNPAAPRITLELYRELCEAEYQALLKRQELEKALKRERGVSGDEIKRAEERSLAAQELPEITQPKPKEALRKREVEARFFRPERTRKARTRKLARAMIKNRRTETAAAIEPMESTAIPSGRAVITAEWATQRLSGAIGECTGWLADGGGGYTCKEKVVFGVDFGEAVYKQKVDPCPNRLGDCFFDGPGTYTNIYGHLRDVTKDDPELEKQLAVCMIEFTRHLAPITPKILQERFKLEEGMATAKAKLLNGIFYLILIKESTQWLSAPDEDCKLAFTLSMARALILLREGYLRLADLFSPTGKYGIFVLPRLYFEMDKVKMRIEATDRMYNEYLIASDPVASSSRIRCAARIVNPTFIASRQQMRHDLQMVYSGESDTDGEGYESDVDALPIAAFK